MNENDCRLQDTFELRLHTFELHLHVHDEMLIMNTTIPIRVRVRILNIYLG